MLRLPEHFYQSTDVVTVAKNLIGKKLVSDYGGGITSGMITETEAYHQTEKACHAYNGRYTKRTRILFEPGGVAYVYLCYGIHYLLNVTTGTGEEAAAVLIRAIQPLEGISNMLMRRSMSIPGPRLSNGPGKLAEAMRVTMVDNGKSLVHGKTLWIEKHMDYDPQQISATPRIGVDYAGKDALLPWRFYLSGNKFVSKT
jgi:DNA-3-methyladenine glycosylase